ncbi:MAG: alpha-L-arabinofuranosidase [Lachnospiraceae bacterium]|nr:alpha-L-arabinofuranosidase [Lachnospiraceae bacterium]
MSLVTEGTLNEKRQAALQVAFDTAGSIYNIGFSGVSVKKGEVYHLYFFAKTKEQVKLTCSLKEKNVLAQKDILVQGSGYNRYDLELIPDETVMNAKFVVTADEGGEVTFGFFSLMPTDTFHNHGLRKDLCEKLEAMKPAFLRFPGGCIVEGFSKSTAQYFRRMTGPVWERPGVWNLWSYHSTEGLGFHEYLQLAEDLQAEALYVCNCGMTCQARNCILMEEEEIDDLLQDTLDALEYAKGSADTKWGAVRAAMGHPEPFRLRYLEIGNENNGEEYEKRYEYFRERILKEYPDLIIIANTHVEEKGLQLDIADEHFYDRTEWFAAHADQYDKTDRQGPGIFVGEFAVVAGNRRTLYAALGEADFMIGLERNQDIVRMAAYAPLFENVDYVAWEPNLIAFNGLQNYAIPSYYVWKLFGENRGKYVLESEQESEQLYTPDLQGGPCMLGAPGVKFKNPLWNGTPADKPVHELIGHMICEDEEGKVYSITGETEGQDTEHIRMFGLEGTAMVTLTEDETSRQGTFEVEVFVESGKAVGTGIFAAPYGEREDLSDARWNLFTVQPIRWVIQDGVSKLTGGVGFRTMELAEPVPVELETETYHTMKMVTDGYTLSCILDGKVITEIELSHYATVQMVALEEDEDIIIKMVNIAEHDIAVDIHLDCLVEEEYRAGLLSGNPADKNTMENPELLTDTWRTMTGAASDFVYHAPKSSVTVLRLKKKQ